MFKRAIKTFVARYESGNTGFFVGGTWNVESLSPLIYFFSRAYGFF